MARSKQPRCSSILPRRRAIGTRTRAPTTVGGPTTVMRSAKDPESPSQAGGGIVSQRGSPVARSRAISRRSGISSMIDISLYWSRCSKEKGIWRGATTMPRPAATVTTRSEVSTASSKSLLPRTLSQPSAEDSRLHSPDPSKASTAWTLRDVLTMTTSPMRCGKRRLAPLRLAKGPRGNGKGAGQPADPSSPSRTEEVIDAAATEVAGPREKLASREAREPPSLPDASSRPMARSARARAPGAPSPRSVRSAAQSSRLTVTRWGSPRRSAAARAQARSPSAAWPSSSSRSPRAHHARSADSVRGQRRATSERPPRSPAAMARSRARRARRPKRSRYRSWPSGGRPKRARAAQLAAPG